MSLAAMRPQWKKGPAIAGLFFSLSVLFASPQESAREFLESFTPAVIRIEKKRGNYRWGEKNRDCAGLVRYLFWELTQKHDETFYARYPEMSRFSGAIISHTVKSGNTAAELIANSRPLGRAVKPSQWKTGDLVYFNSPERRIRHVMLVLRARGELFLVYHTGDVRDELRIRTLKDIMSLSESEWHIEAANPAFQGIYRPHFLA